jgi:hypothetical protein
MAVEYDVFQKEWAELQAAGWMADVQYDRGGPQLRNGDIQIPAVLHDDGTPETGAELVHRAHVELIRVGALCGSGEE